MFGVGLAISKPSSQPFSMFTMLCLAVGEDEWPDSSIELKGAVAVGHQPIGKPEHTSEKGIA